MRQPNLFTLLLLTCFSVSCSSLPGFGGSDLAPQSLNIQGTYTWVDGFGTNTACIVHIFWQHEAWRGWLRTDNNSAEICPWDGYELARLRMQGDRVRMSITCPRSGCPSNDQRSTTYLLDVVPGVMLSGRAIGTGIVARWHNIRLVHRNES